MAVRLNTLIGPIEDILKSKKDFLLITQEEYDNLSKSTNYENVEFGKVDDFDIKNDCEPSNNPVYYVPVGDGLYRPTQNRKIFLSYACKVLDANHFFDIKTSAEFADTPFGDQLQCLLDNGYHYYDICLALKARISELRQMIGKTNNSDIPIYIRNKWLLGFAITCDWNPARNRKLDEQTRQNIGELRKAFNVGTIETKGTLIGTKYTKFVDVDTETVDWTDPKLKNVLVCRFKKNGVRGPKRATVNVDTVAAWIKEDPTVNKVLPFTCFDDLANFLVTHQISVSGFLREFGRKGAPFGKAFGGFGILTNERFGYEFVAESTIAAAPEPKKESNKTPTPTPKKSDDLENEWKIKVKRTLCAERKYGIATIRKLFTVLEPVATRQQVIDLFHVTEYELRNPAELTLQTATTINLFCGKSVSIGR